MKFAVVPIPTKLAEKFADLEIKPIVMGYFPESALEKMGWNKKTVLFMTVENNGFWIREEKEVIEGELEYVIDGTEGNY